MKMLMLQLLHQFLWLRLQIWKFGVKLYFFWSMHISAVFVIFFQVETSIVHIGDHERLKNLPAWIINGDGSNLTQEQMVFLSSELNGRREVGVKSIRDHGT